MFAWSFEIGSVHEFERLLRAVGRHRYAKESACRLHFSVDLVLGETLAAYRGRAEAVKRVRNEVGEMGSRDPRLWAECDIETMIQAARLFWNEDRAVGSAAHEALAAVFRDAGLPAPSHEPWRSDADEPPHPELLLLDWSWLAVDELDTERHAGALRALEDSGDEMDVSARPSVEGPSISVPELSHAFAKRPRGELLLWADGPYAYCDYVLRGVAKVAKLPRPLGYRDF